MREALIRYGADEGEDAGQDIYSPWMDVIGAVNLGGRDPARTTGDQFADILRGRPRARRAR